MSVESSDDFGKNNQDFFNTVVMDEVSGDSSENVSKDLNENFDIKDILQEFEYSSFPYLPSFKVCI